MSLTITRMDHRESLPMDLLLLADPSEEMIEKYRNSGESYLAKQEEELVGVFIMMPITNSEIELKSIAVYPQYQRLGYGKEMVKYAIRIAKMEAYKAITVKTADVSEYQIRFYEKLKFELETTVKGHYIQYYKDPIIENKKEAVDQLVFKRIL
jgi:ribosomal protein S18 acetylase RimI-like enzyme